MNDAVFLLAIFQIIFLNEISINKKSTRKINDNLANKNQDKAKSSLNAKPIQNTKLKWLEKLEEKEEKDMENMV